MANNNIDEQMVKESLECPICKDFFEEPKQLLCGHTFCNTCIARLDKITIPGTRCYEFDDHYNLVYGVEFSIQCPQCREMCKIPPHGLNTNYVVKEMVDKFREVYVSAAIVSSPVCVENNAEKKVLCHECSRKTFVSELFLCKDCKPHNKLAKELFICSLCIIKSHKLHDVIMCSELATTREREQASNQIVNVSQKAYEQVQRMKVIEEDLIQEIEQNCKRLVHGMNNFTLLHEQCYDAETNPLKKELEEKIVQAKCLEEHFNKACVQLNKIKEQAVFALRNIESVVNWSKFNNNSNEDVIHAPTFIDIHSCSNEPGTSSGRVQNFLPISALASPTNSFVYNDIDRKRRNARQRKPARRVNNNRVLSDSRGADTIEIEAYVLD